MTKRKDLSDLACDASEVAARLSGALALIKACDAYETDDTIIYAGRLLHDGIARCEALSMDIDEYDTATRAQKGGAA